VKFDGVREPSVGRIYGGILGLLAFQTTLIRGWIHHDDLETTLWTAWLSLMAFTAVGVVVGWIAGRIVEDFVAARVSAELDAQEAEEAKKKKKQDKMAVAK
jgi:ammonia channel protein AmtB